jgi:hypothetical protein
MTNTQPNLTPRTGGEKKQAPPQPKSFLFINKDPESEVLSRSSGRVAASINSHVQRWQEKKGGRSKPQSSSKAQAPQQPSKAADYRDSVIKFRPKPRKRGEKEVPKPQTQRERQHSESSSSGPRTAYSTTPEGSSENDGAMELLRHDAYRPWPDTIYQSNFSGADCIDPFQSTYAHYPGVQPILQYYISFTLISTFQGNTKVKGVTKEPPHFPAIRSIVRGSLSRQMHMYALLAATAARMKRVSGISLPRESSPEFLLHNAIRCIREYFASCTGPLTTDDRQVILDIFYLCVCEWYEKSYDVARTHLAFVRHFWNSLRPSESIFDKYIHDMITYNDVFLAIETASPPLFELTWEPQELPAERIHEIEDEISRLSISPSQSPSPASIASHSPLSATTSSPYSISPNPTFPIGSGFVFLATAVNTQLPNDIIAILVDLIPLIQAAYHHTHTLTPPPPQESQWVSLKTQALLHRLLSLHVSHHPAAESIRLALIILLSCLSTSAAWRSGKVDMAQQARRLRTALSLPSWQDARYPIVIDNIHYPAPSPPPSPSLHGADDTTLLWILVTGAFAAQNAIGEEQWFLGRAADVARRLGIFEASRLQSELQRYLFLDSLESITFERLCTAMGMVRQDPGN